MRTYEFLQLQSVWPHTWLTGPWEEPDGQVQLVMTVLISGTLETKKSGTASQLQLA